ncbi:MAG: hypothetical protein ACKO2P_09335 [Planctomycetota bacterium]
MVINNAVETRRTVRSAVVLQTLLALPLAIGSLFFGLSLIVLVSEALDGRWRALIAVPVVAAIATSLGTESLSLFRGCGVPAWFMKACLAAGVCGVIGMTGYSGWLCFFGGQPDVGAAALGMMLLPLISFLPNRQAPRRPE